MRTKPVTSTTSKTAVKLMVVSSLAITNGTSLNAAEKKSYTAPPFAPFSSQMSDALLGSDKYEKPVWNLHDALNLPKWLDMSVEQRTRYETMDGSFKANGKGGDQQIPLQTDLWLQAHLGKFRIGAEFLDSRALAADSGSGVNNTHADNADFIQGYMAWASQNIFYSGIGAEVIAGRQSLNFGSRRLIARNAMRNTINSFTGVRLRFIDYGNWQFNGFVTMPVNRYPNASADILEEIHEFDEEDTHTWFSGGFLEIYDLFAGINGEVYLYHLDEGDSIRNQTRNRRYFTPGNSTFNWKPSASSARCEPVRQQRTEPTWIMRPGTNISTSAIPSTCPGSRVLRWNTTMPAATKTPTTTKTNVSTLYTAPAASSSAPPAFTEHLPAATSTRRVTASMWRRVPI